MKLYHHIFSFLAAGALLSGCAAEQFDAPEPSPEGAVTITARATEMLPQVLMSRAFGDENFEPKEAEEKRINRLHLFFFDSDGNFLQKNESAKAQWDPYYVAELGKSQLAAVSVPKDAFVDQANLTGVQIFAVANAICDDPNCDHKDCKFRVEGITPDGKICHGDMSDPKKEMVIRKLKDLQDWYYRPQERKDEEITKLPAGGMPMVTLFKSGADQAILSKDGRIELDMRALMARVDVQVRLDANQTSHDHQLPTLRVTEYGIKNMPVCVPFSDVPANDTTLIGKGNDLVPEKTVKVNDRTLIDGQEAMLFTYYTYENVRDSIGEANYPSAIVRDDKNGELKQRWKPTIAQKETASAFVMKGHYTTHQGLEYQAQFTVYLGKNTTGNFDVRRNHCYKNRISIRGLDYVRNNDTDVYTFDGRVNVRTENPVYISIVNERKIDAHATALPMDIYFLRMQEGTATCPSTVDIEILADPLTGDIPKWIRMEKVPAVNMTSEPAGLDNTTYIYDRGVLTAGRGARRYFTQNLVTETLKDSVKLTVGNNYQGSDPQGGNRTRIYFYIDENVPTSNNPGPEYGDRTATIRIHYKNDEGEDRDRTLEIDQKALLHVTGSGDGRTINYWMEYYEEYMDHKDPLDKHDMPAEMYTGLPWSKRSDGGDTYETNDDYREYIYRNFGLKEWWMVGSWELGNRYRSFDIYGERDGWWMTEFMLRGRSGRMPITDVQTYNDKIPPTAFHYCYGKNKRSSSPYGDVPTGQKGYWFLPGIKDLEIAMEEYYATFPEFQKDFYWSASSAKRSSTRESTSEARATAIKDDGSHFGSSEKNEEAYNPSNPRSGGGRANRTQALRIRAGYIIVN